MINVGEEQYRQKALKAEIISDLKEIRIEQFDPGQKITDQN